MAGVPYQSSVGLERNPLDGAPVCRIRIKHNEIVYNVIANMLKPETVKPAYAPRGFRMGIARKEDGLSKLFSTTEH